MPVKDGSSRGDCLWYCQLFDFVRETSKTAKDFLVREISAAINMGLVTWYETLMEEDLIKGQLMLSLLDYAKKANDTEFVEHHLETIERGKNSISPPLYTFYPTFFLFSGQQTSRYS